MNHTITLQEAVTITTAVLLIIFGGTALGILIVNWFEKKEGD